MADSDWPEKLVSFGYELQSRFDAYMVALTFTVLGFSIQTIEPAAPTAALTIELLAWAALLVSGLAGISRLAWQPQIYQLFGVQAGQQNRISGLLRSLLQGTATAYVATLRRPVPLEDLVNNDTADLAKVEARVKSLIEGSQRRYRIQQLFFADGILALGVARAYALFASIAVAVRCTAG